MEKEINKNFIKNESGYFIKENEQYSFLPFEKTYSLEELIKITITLNEINLDLKSKQK